MPRPTQSELEQIELNGLPLPVTQPPYRNKLLEISVEQYGKDAFLRFDWKLVKRLRPGKLEDRLVEALQTAWYNQDAATYGARLIYLHDDRVLLEVRVTEKQIGRQCATYSKTRNFVHGLTVPARDQFSDQIHETIPA